MVTSCVQQEPSFLFCASLHSRQKETCLIPMPQPTKKDHRWPVEMSWFLPPALCTDPPRTGFIADYTSPLRPPSGVPVQVYTPHFTIYNLHVVYIKKRLEHAEWERSVAYGQFTGEAYHAKPVFAKHRQ